MAPPFCKTARSKGAKAEATLIRDTISLPIHLKIPQFLLFIINLESGVSCINKILRGAVATRTPLSSPVAIPSSSNKLVINLKRLLFFSIPLHPADCKKFAFRLRTIKLCWLLPALYVAQKINFAKKYFENKIILFNAAY